MQVQILSVTPKRINMKHIYNLFIIPIYIISIALSCMLILCPIFIYEEIRSIYKFYDGNGWNKIKDEFKKDPWCHKKK